MLNQRCNTFWIHRRIHALRAPLLSKFFKVDPLAVDDVTMSASRPNAVIQNIFPTTQIGRPLTFALDSHSNESVGVVCPQCGPSA